MVLYCAICFSFVVYVLFCFCKRLVLVTDFRLTKSVHMLKTYEKRHIP